MVILHEAADWVQYDHLVEVNKIKKIYKITMQQIISINMCYFVAS